MNILLLNAGKGWGGIESHGVILASQLIRKGHKVIIGCPTRGQVKDNAEKLNLPVRNINVVNSGDATAVLRMIQWGIKEKVQVIIANLGKEYWPGAVAAKLMGIKLVFVRHQMDRLKASTTWLVSHHVDRIIAVSQAVKDSLIEVGISPAKIQVIYTGIEIDKFTIQPSERDRIRKQLGIKEDEIVVGNAGKLDESKGVLDLLKAGENIINRNPKVRLLYVGEGPCRELMEKEIQKSKIQDKVIFAGLQREMVGMYSAMDICVIASKIREAFGLVLVEAMAMGIPVIGTAIGGIPEIITHEKNGLLVPPGDVDALTKAIERYIDQPVLGKQLTANGQVTVTEKFSAEKMAGEYETLLKGLGIC